MNRGRLSAIINDQRAAALYCFIAIASLFTCYIPALHSQPFALTSLPIQNFTTDNLQNIYVITPQSEVVKLNSKGQVLFRYPNKTLGQAAFLDATDPFNLLLFFPEYQTVLLLDHTLSPIARYNLFQLGLFQVHAVGMAGDGSVWVYDEANFRLKKITPSGAVKAESGDLSLVPGKAIQPNFLTERQQHVFLNAPQTGILVFDAFGRYLKTIDIKGLREFQIIDNRIVYFKDGELRSFHLTALLDQPLATPQGLKKDSRLRLGRENLYVLEGSTLKIYPDWNKHH